MLRMHPYDEMLYLCLHLAAQHRFDRLIWLVDISQLLIKLPSDWNWDRFTREIIARGGATPVALALERAHAQLGAEIPMDVLQRLNVASKSARERAAWRLAHVAFANPRRVGLHLLSLPTIPQQLAFTREIVATGLRGLFPMMQRHVTHGWSDRTRS